MSGEAMEEGVTRLLSNLSDIIVDVPKAAHQVGAALGALAAEGAVPLRALAEHVRTADADPPPEGEDTMLVGDGQAKKVRRGGCWHRCAGRWRCAADGGGLPPLGRVPGALI